MGLRIFIAILLAIGLVRCQDSKGTTTGNPVVSLVVTGSSEATTVAKNFLDLFFQSFFKTAVAYPPPSTMVDRSGNTVTITETWWTIDEIEFKYDEAADSGEVDGEDLEIEGPFTVDLLSNSPSALVSQKVTKNNLRRIKTKLKRTTTLPSGAPSDLLNQALLIEGSVNGNSFQFKSNDEVTFEIAGPNLLSFSDGSTLLVELKTANLIKRISLSAITTNNTVISNSNRVTASNPCPTVDASATDLYTCFKKGLETESNIGRDDDEDGVLDSDEDSVN